MEHLFRLIMFFLFIKHCTILLLFFLMVNGTWDLDDYFCDITLICSSHIATALLSEPLFTFQNNYLFREATRSLNQQEKIRKKYLGTYYFHTWVLTPFTESHESIALCWQIVTFVTLLNLSFYRKFYKPTWFKNFSQYF